MDEYQIQKNVDHFNFKHERMNKNSLIIAICLSYLDFFLFFFQNKSIFITQRNVDCFNFKYDRLNRNSLIKVSISMRGLNKNRNVDFFNFKHERQNKNSLVMALCLSSLDFLLFFKQWININYNKI